MFDLPTLTPEDRRHYRRFRRDLMKIGFYQLQESVYTRMALNGSVESSLRERVRRIKPPAGSVFMLSCTEKQFAKSEMIVGAKKTDVVDSDEKVVIL